MAVKGQGAGAGGRGQDQGAGPLSSSTAVEPPQWFEPWVQAELRPSPALSSERLQRVAPAGQGPGSLHRVQTLQGRGRACWVSLCPFSFVGAGNKCCRDTYGTPKPRLRLPYELQHSQHGPDNTECQTG